MTEREAAARLEDEEVVACVEGSMSYAKDVQRACLEADIPALLGSPPGKRGS